jgi:hypothetical protein
VQPHAIKVLGVQRWQNILVLNTLPPNELIQIPIALLKYFKRRFQRVCCDFFEPRQDIAVFVVEFGDSGERTLDMKHDVEFSAWTG